MDLECIIEGFSILACVMALFCPFCVKWNVSQWSWARETIASGLDLLKIFNNTNNIFTFDLSFLNNFISIYFMNSYSFSSGNYHFKDLGCWQKTLVRLEIIRYFNQALNINNFYCFSPLASYSTFIPPHLIWFSVFSWLDLFPK